MTIVRVTREKIAKAIEKEPLTTLQPGRWVGSLDDSLRSSEVPVSSKACSVCAVGAVMRNALLDRKQPADAIHSASCEATGRAQCVPYAGHAAGIRDEAVVLVEAGYHMAALSTYFEGLAGLAEDEDGNLPARKARSIRAKVAKFVRKHFPAKVEIDIDGAKPAKDVFVVKAKKEKK